MWRLLPFSRVVEADTTPVESSLERGTGATGRAGDKYALKSAKYEEAAEQNPSPSYSAELADGSEARGSGWHKRLVLFIYFVGLSVLVWVCVSGDIVRTFIGALNMLLVVVAGKGFEFESIPPPESVDFFKVVPDNATGEVLDVVELNPFPVYLLNGNLLTFLVTVCVMPICLVAFLVFQCKICSEEEWMRALEDPGPFPDAFEEDGTPPIVILGGCIFIVCVFGSIFCVWLGLIDMLDALQLHEWLFVPGNEELANGLGYSLIVAVLWPCWVCCLLQCCLLCWVSRGTQTAELVAN